MDISHILVDLNEPQRKAVSADNQHLLVLAGAGSGKTRVLVHRIAWLIEIQQLSPFSILAVTFTNKAAAEMKSRIERLIDTPADSMWIGTFHGLAHRLLRHHWQEAHLPQNFQILDSDDQYRLIRRILKSMELDEKQWPARQIQWYINHNKDEARRAKDIKADDFYSQTMGRIYQTYEENCERSGLVDFAELLLRAYELWRDNPLILKHYQHRFQHILIDEFQDTNTIQYGWIKLLMHENNALTIVGDDDQSIYGWRGAKIENIQRCQKEFHGTELIRLEQNYRSTGNILSAANAVIANNNSRLGKELWTDSKNGDPISLYEAFNDIDEARFIVNSIQQWIQQGNLRKEAAILYRSNAQSRILEENLIHAGIPYRVYGGMRFFDRAEIKDALAYLRLISHRDSDAAFERIVNTPTRGIGERTLSMLRDTTKSQSITLWQACQQLIAHNSLPARAHSALVAFIDLINQLADDISDLTLAQQVEHIISESKLYAHFQKEKGEKAQARLENLQELVTAADQFMPDSATESSPLDAFLSHAALEAGDAQANEYSDCVQLMTLHTAKGLEFPLVFLCGMEEGLFPHKLSTNDPSKLEEERRLCYVGMTRAMKKLYITHAEMRRFHGEDNYQRVSRFVNEIPAGFVEEIRLRKQVHRPAITQKKFNSNKISGNNHAIADTGLKMGQRVQHKKFGEGVVMNYEGAGNSARIQVKFSRQGTKWLVASLAKLEPVL